MGKTLYCYLLCSQDVQRADIMNDSLMGIIDTLTMARPLAKDDEAITELLKNIHYFACQAGAALNIAREEMLKKTLEENTNGKLFDKFLNQGGEQEDDSPANPWGFSLN